MDRPVAGSPDSPGWQAAPVQYSLFGAAVAAPSLDDLDGVLLAGGRWVRQGSTARLSVVVGAPWRAEALAAEFDARSLAGAITEAEQGVGVRTAFSATLLSRAELWTRGASEAVPPGLALTPGGLRLWAVVAGRRDEAGYLLGTALPDDPVHRAGGSALSRLGIAAVSLVRIAPGWRVTSARRLRRLAELVGPAPDGAGPDWPGVVSQSW